MVLGKTLFIALTLVAIGAQVPHAYHAFTENSKLRSKNLRIIQGMLFCGILSVAIFAFVLIEKPMLALLGALIESLINVYYYTSFNSYMVQLRLGMQLAIDNRLTFQFLHGTIKTFLDLPNCCGYMVSIPTWYN